MYLLHVNIRFCTTEQLQSSWCGSYHRSDLYIAQRHDSKVRSGFILKLNLRTLESDKVDMAASQCKVQELKHNLCCHFNNPQELLWQLNYLMLLVAGCSTKLSIKTQVLCEVSLLTFLFTYLLIYLLTYLLT